VRSERFGTSARPLLRASFPCRGADLSAARSCEALVFARRFGNSAHQLAREYGPYEASTVFGGVFLPDGSAVGCVRLIRPDGRGPVKTLSDAAGPPWNLSRQLLQSVVGDQADPDVGETWDVATFGVDGTATGGDRRVTMALLSVMFGAFRDNAVGGLVAMLDTGARRAFRGLGLHVNDIPGALSASYLGSASTTPVHRRIDVLHAEHFIAFPHVHQQVFHGWHVDGLDEQMCAPGAFALFADAVEAGC
jgi:hypothetical protein